MTRRKTKLIIVALMLLIIAAPLSAMAAVGEPVYGGYKTGDPLVPCGTTKNPTPCTICHLYILIQNIIGFLMWVIAPVVAVLAVAWGGFNILISGEKPGQRAKGFEIIKKTVIGLAIMFAGWVLINEALLFFGNKSTNVPTIGSVQATSTNIWLPWNEIKCSIPEIKQ